MQARIALLRKEALVSAVAVASLFFLPLVASAATLEAIDCGGGNSNDSNGVYCGAVAYVGYTGEAQYNFELRFATSTQELAAATLYLYVTDRFGGGSDVNVYVGKRTISSLATWNSYNGTDAWETGGGRGGDDRYSAPIGSGTVNADGWVGISLNATATAAMLESSERALHVDVSNPTGDHRVSIDFETNLPYLDVTVATPPFSVSEGGTGATSFTTNGVLFGNGTSAIQATAAGTAYQVLRVGSGGGAPSFGAVNLSQSAAVEGVLPVANGGTGTTSTLPGAVLFAGASAVQQDDENLFWDNTNKRLGIGTNSPTTRLEVSGTVAATHFKGAGPTAGIDAGACAGTGASASLDGTDAAGTITLETGTATAGNAACLTVSFDTAYNTAPHVIFSPSNPAAALLSGGSMIYATSATNTFQLLSGPYALAGSTTYKWSYYVVE